MLGNGCVTCIGGVMGIGCVSGIWCVRGIGCVMGIAWVRGIGCGRDIGCVRGIGSVRGIGCVRGVWYVRAIGCVRGIRCVRGVGCVGIGCMRHIGCARDHCTCKRHWVCFWFQVSGRPARGTSTAAGGPRKRGAPNRHRAAYSVPPSGVVAGGPWQHPAPPGADTCRFQGGGSAFGVGGAVGVYQLVPQSDAAPQIDVIVQNRPWRAHR